MSAITEIATTELAKLRARLAATKRHRELLDEATVSNREGAPIGENTRPVAPSDLRPFFGFYGGKWRDAVKHYPAPRYKTIVEPFAGSAGYAVRYAHLDVVLCEADPVIAGVWQYLTKVKAKEILAIPDVPLDGSVDDLNLVQEAGWLVGFWLNRGASRPRSDRRSG